MTRCLILVPLILAHLALFPRKIMVPLSVRLTADKAMLQDD